ncbi:MAG: SpaA isopeptide-forming pilin-related protein, partial [Peptoniphilus harei]|nr:SpaA isopeptide-forming pilin-related protein [Peptoniphilus harei]
MAYTKVDDTTYTFKMPASNVGINVSYEKPQPANHNINITSDNAQGSVSASPASAKKGDKVTLTVTPNPGFEIASVSMNGTALTATNGVYTFTMPDGDVNVVATFKQLDLGKQIPTNGAAIIKNKQTGIELKIAKKDNNGKALEGAEFTIQEEGKEAILATATSDKDGNVVFVDKDKKPIKLTKGGKYTLTETKAPIGFKKAAAPWHIEVIEVNGQLVIKKSGPEATSSSFLTSKKAVAADYQTGKIKYKSIVKSIDTTSKTFVQRLYVDTRNYGRTVNLQIKPKHKREEIDRAGLPPVTITEGVKTAYRSTYKVTNPGANINVDEVLNQYDLRQPNVSVVNTARWRPFDWGFDEDILNLEPGVYFIDIEGYYDQSIVDKKVTNEVNVDSNYNFIDNNNQPSAEPVKKAPYERTDIPDGDLGKIELHFDFFDGAREFQEISDVSNLGYKHFEKGSYQHGATNIRNWMEQSFRNQGYSAEQAKNFADNWAKRKQPGQKYVNALSKKVKINSTDRNWVDTGIINPSVTGTPAAHVDTSLDISSLYTSDKLETIPQEGMSVTNDKEVYNITFSKHGEGGDDNTNRLEGAVFKLQKKEGSFWNDLDDSYVSSAFNGYFGFRRLEPGSYRLIEVSPPKGYRAIDGTLLEFTINTFDPHGETETRADGKTYDKKSGLQVEKQTDGTNKVIDPQTGKIIENANGYVTIDSKQDSLKPNVVNSDATKALVDFVTSATAKNIGKVINKVPGQGKVKITKYGDDTTKLLPGVKFVATKLSLEKDEKGNPKPAATYTGTTGQNGEVIIDGLPIGNYELREEESVSGHINTGQVWHFTVGGDGLDPYANDTSSGGRNLTNNITLTGSTIKVVQPQQNNNVVNNPKQIFPHSGETFRIENNYKIDPSVKINAGDYFILKLSDNIDLEGVRRGEQDNLDLFADGVGTIAKAKYDKEAGTITYTFTKYADQYTLQDFSNTLAAHPTLNRVKNSGWQSVGTSVGSDKSKYKDIYFNYVVDTEYGYDNSGNYINMASKIVSFNSETGEFVHYFYINRERQYSNLNLTFRYQPSANVSDLKFTKYSLTYNSDYYLYDSMPASFGVDENNSNLVNEGTTSFGDVNAYQTRADYIGKFPSDQSMIIKVTGKIDTRNLLQYKGFSGLYFGYRSNGYWYEYPNAYRWDGIYAFGNDNNAKAELNIRAVNPTNKIQFKKVDESGKILTGAQFSLYKNDGTIEKPSQVWTAKGDPKGTDTNGLISYEKLEQGLYKLEETTPPTNYIKPTEPVAIFKVDENGKIFREVTVNKADGEGTEKIFQEVDGSIPIEIINYKAIQFVKIDGDNKDIYLQGARFEVWKKANKDATDY